MSDNQVEHTEDKNEQPALPILPTKKRFRWLRIVFLLVFFTFIIIQFFPPDKNNSARFSRNDISSIITIPDTVQQLLNTACYDCHSNNTNYPWYTNIQPGGWWMENHVEDGKRHLNFSEFENIAPKNGKTTAQRQDHLLEEIKETIENDEMPLNSYLWIHSDAKLSKQQKKLITDWTDSARKELSKLSIQRNKQ